MVCVTCIHDTDKFWILNFIMLEIRCDSFQSVFDTKFILTWPVLIFFSRSIVHLENVAHHFLASSLVFLSGRLYCGCLLYSFGAKYRASNFFSVKSTLVYLLVHSQTLIIGGFSLEKLDFDIWQIFMYAGYELPFLLYHHWIIVLGVNPLEKLNIS